MINEHNHGLSLRKALAYTDCSRNFYYYRKRRRITRCQQDQTILEITKEIVLQRPSYGTRRMETMLTRVLGKSINRKRVQKIYHKLNLTIPSRKKREIIRSKYKDVKKVDRPHEIWEVDLTYVHVALTAGDIYSVFLMYLRENG